MTHPAGVLQQPILEQGLSEMTSRDSYLIPQEEQQTSLHCHNSTGDYSTALWCYRLPEFFACSCSLCRPPTYSSFCHRLLACSLQLTFHHHQWAWASSASAPLTVMLGQVRLTVSKCCFDLTVWKYFWEELPLKHSWELKSKKRTVRELLFLLKNKKHRTSRQDLWLHKNKSVRALKPQ